MGKIEAGVHSWIHRHPVVTQVTFLIAGQLTIRMQEPNTDTFYDVEVHPGEAVLCQPDTLFQLRNDSEQVATVLYLVSP
ncbi:MAG: cupin domain-containing protein, partial [Bdellovibrionales bacterium]|nr:cupin domain-containing protein [Bdellovibrionales bacterium]